MDQRFDKARYGATQDDPRRPEIFLHVFLQRQGAGADSPDWGSHGEPGGGGVRKKEVPQNSRPMALKYKNKEKPPTV